MRTGAEQAARLRDRFAAVYELPSPEVASATRLRSAPASDAPAEGSREARALHRDRSRALVASAATRAAAAEFEGPLEIAAYGWLELLDAGRFDDAWREGDRRCCAAASRRPSGPTATRKVRDGFGAVASRSVANKDYHRQIEGGPDGNYFTLRIVTSLADGREVVEVVTLRRARIRSTGPPRTESNVEST